MRMWGWKENELEQKRDMEELTALAKAGKPLYGGTDLPEYMQGVAHRNSLWSQLKFGVMPWSVHAPPSNFAHRFDRFNMVKCVEPTLDRALLTVLSSHNHHGVDTTKYGTKEE